MLATVISSVSLRHSTQRYAARYLAAVSDHIGHGALWAPIVAAVCAASFVLLSVSLILTD